MSKKSSEVITVNDIATQIIRSPRRKTISIEVKHGDVYIVVPSTLSTARIKEILKKKTKWINKKVAEYQQRPPLQSKEYVSGEKYNYLGEAYPLKIEINSVPFVELLNGQLLVTLPEKYNFAENIKGLLSTWYHNQALRVFEEKVLHYEKLVGVRSSDIEIKKYKARWGSCTIHRKVQFNWKLMMAPHYVVDYVVVHELCHIHEHNHSRAFWAHVERVCPEYRECKTWLKDNGHLLEV